MGRDFAAPTVELALRLLELAAVDDDGAGRRAWPVHRGGALALLAPALVAEADPQMAGIAANEDARRNRLLGAGQRDDQ